MSRNDFSRRGFLRGALAGAAALTVSPLPIIPSAFAANAPNNGKFMVIINLFGGNDGLNTVVPTQLQPYFDRRPTLALTSGLHDLDGSWALHPALSSLKGMWDDGDMHVIQRVGYPNQNLSHFTSMNIYSYGVRDINGSGDGRGWLGRFADTYCSDPVEPLGIISVGTGRRRDFEADIGETLVIDSVPNFVFEEDRDWRDDHELRLRVARTIVEGEVPPAGGTALTVFGTSRQAHQLVDLVQLGTAGWTDPGTYANDTLGRNLKEVSRLLHGRDQFHTKVFYTGMGGFDTHSGQLSRHQSLMSQLNSGVGALSADLKARGLWDDCVIMVISEFGRRNFENGSSGTDHGHGNAFLLAGGAVNSGITGTVSEADLNINQPDFQYDFREVYAHLIDDHIGVPSGPIFPETFTTTGDISVV